MRIAFKPTSTIGVKQRTVTREGEEVRRLCWRRRPGRCGCGRRQQGRR
jgi:chorismate synthase